MNSLFKVLSCLALALLVICQDTTNTTAQTISLTVIELGTVNTPHIIFTNISQTSEITESSEEIPPSITTSTEALTEPETATSITSSETSRIVLNVTEINESTTAALKTDVTTTAEQLHKVAVTINKTSENGPVVIDVYYESLCPDSKKLLTTQIWPVVQKLRNETFKDLIHFRFWPYGKSNETFNNETGRWEFSCHHGPNECLGNLWHTCALYGNMTTRGDAEFFIACTYGYSNLSEGFLKCSEQGKFSYPEMASCATSLEANNLMRNTGLKTKSLFPPITYIPTVTINELNDKATSSRAEAEFENLACDLVAAKFQMCNRI